ncbi:MAG: hypothetical protein ACO3MW_13800 [Rhodospirillales bacterium]|jgi:hypothetical protein
MGAPHEPEFQTKVLTTGLNLLLADGTPPLLVDFPEDAPVSVNQRDEQEAWVCPVSFPPPPEQGSEIQKALLEEIKTLAPWYDVAVQNNKRTTFGLSGLSIEDAARFIIRVSEGSTENPITSMTFAEAIKRSVEDIKAFYLEAIAAQPSGATSKDLYSWLWQETAAGKLFGQLQPICAADDDPQMQYLARQSLIPRPAYR